MCSGHYQTCFPAQGVRFSSILTTLGQPLPPGLNVAAALASFAQDTKPVRVENANCGFSIVFPGKPHMSKSKVSTTGKNFIPVTRYYLETRESLLAVSCSVAKRKGQTEQLIDEARGAALRATGTRVVHEQQVGRESASVPNPEQNGDYRSRSSRESQGGRRFIPQQTSVLRMP